MRSSVFCRVSWSVISVCFLWDKEITADVTLGGGLKAEGGTVKLYVI